MVGDERVSRRELLKSGATLRGGLGVGVSVAAALGSEESLTGAWVLEPDESEIVGKRGSIERSTGSMMSLCTSGREYYGRTCDGREIQLLVPRNASQPAVDTTYRFAPTEKRNSCDETHVDVFAASPCRRTTADDAEPKSSASSDSATESFSDTSESDSERQQTTTTEFDA